MEVIAAGLIIYFAYWLWAGYKNGRWNRAEQKPGDDWLVLDTRDHASGFALLLKATDGWVVRNVPHAENERTIAKWYPTEQQARDALARIP